ncbi:hypothetical protein LVY72_03085 [Arthrobacter sp. I2-34]|uniref:Uncharacterized protein n=1 Tax=Arthrobacter hankyongi TaxID=2904801 RepID=A0ABS9L2J0_9MICC|nr:hypothetical protein [Arthrobacter hankyongi]MCG2620895.1 hypothetical protein [Arthrobacter hankyongi]
MPSNEGRAIYRRILREDSLGCSIYHPGHQTHWIQARKGLQDESRLPVSIHVEPELGLLQFGVRGEPQLYWHHNTARIVEVFAGPDGEGIWSPEFHLLTVPSNHGHILFNLAKLDDVGRCLG